MFGILNGIANLALDYCAAKTLVNNQKQPQSREEWAKLREDRKTISNIRNGAYLFKRLIK